MPITKARRAAAFVDSVGTNLHITWGGDTSWADKGRIVRAMQATGIQHARDAVPYDWSQATYERLNRELGVRFLIIPDRGMYNPIQTYRPQLDNIVRLLDACPGSVAAFEGFNEINNTGWTINVGGGNTAADLRLGRDLQAKLWREIHDHPDARVKALEVANLTVASISPDQAFASLGDMSAWADHGSWHTYFGQGDQPRAMLENGWNGARKTVPNKSAMLTETGYYTAVQDMGWGGGGVDYPTQAKLMTSLLLAAHEMGFARSYLYSLMDDPADLARSTNIEASFGICRGDGTPKPAGAAIRRLLDALRDTAANALTFTPGELDYTLTGMPSTGRHMLFQRASGEFVLVLWNEAKVWDQPNKRAINNAPVQVKLTLGRAATAASVSEPMTGSLAIVKGISTIELPLTLADHPVLVTLTVAGSVVPAPAPVTPTPAPAPTPAPVPAPAVPVSATVGQGDRKLVLRLTQDAWNGSARYTIAIDGKQVGGTLTAAATRGSGMADTLTVLGSWVPGAHRADLTFLNDAYGGVPGTDRNLYLESATLDGAAVSGAKLDMLSGGGQGFAFSVPQTTPTPTPAPVPAPTPSGEAAALIAAAKVLAQRVKTAAQADIAAANAALEAAAKLEAGSK